VFLSEADGFLLIGMKRMIAKLLFGATIKLIFVGCIFGKSTD
jgi:hypothetical protein